MSNIQSILKSEISRIARKEVRAETGALKKSSTQYRSEIAALKRRLANLEKLLKRQARTIKAVAPAARDAGDDESKAEGLRFRAKGFAAHRQRLGLSAAQAGALLGVSQLSVYKWESGQTKPRAMHMPRIAAFRKLGRKQAAAAVAQVMASSQ
ncbi:MAG: transcriptional regulator, family [Nitrospira sp.]|jgi:DNA-binding transcriptional regulator YiaG|nr:transcriptional regulator, family [Nitrospira sp.]